jgi:hypothetical protein
MRVPSAYILHVEPTVCALSRSPAGCGTDQKLEISHETIYRYVWADKPRGGTEIPR